MSYFLAGAFQSEFNGNAYALGDFITFYDLNELYSYNTSMGGAIAAILGISFCYQMIWLTVLTLQTTMKRRGVLRRVRANRLKVRRIVNAKLRWYNTYCSSRVLVISTDCVLDMC